MALDAVDQAPPQDLATVPEKSKEGDDDDVADDSMRRVKMLSRERRDLSRRSLSRHSSGGIGLMREKNRVPRAQSMRIVRPLAPSLENSGSGLNADKPPSTPRRQIGSSRSGRNSLMRGVSRAKSMADGPLTRSLARSDSGRGMPQRRHVGRTPSQRSLAHMASESSLRPYQGHDKVVNQSIQGGSRPTLRRSPDDRSYSDLSSFTMATDQSHGMKCADPLDDQTYRETDSMADHESCISGDFADYTEFLPENNPNHIPYDGASMADGTLCTFDSVQLRRRQIMATNSNHSFDASSFSTFASGEGEFDDYLGESGYYDEFYLDETHVVEEDDAENAENSDSDDEETIEGEVSDNDAEEEDDDDDDDDED